MLKIKDDVVVRDITSAPLPDSSAPLQDEPSFQIIYVEKNDFRIGKNGFQKPSEAVSSVPKDLIYESNENSHETIKVRKKVIQDEKGNEESFVVSNPMYQE